MKKVYLAGQPDKYSSDWKKKLKAIAGFDFYDWEIDSDQASADTYFPDDLAGIYSSNIMIANPGLAPSEATWTEIGIFYIQNTEEQGLRCRNLIIIWQEERNPKWSIDFIEKMGTVVNTIDGAIAELKKL